MKILFVSHGASRNGGAELCFLELIQSLKQSNEDLDIYAVFPSKGSLYDSCAPFLKGAAFIKQPWWIVAVEKWRFIKHLTFPIRVLTSVIRLSKYFKAIQPDLVVTNTIAIPSAAICSKLNNLKHIWFIHEVPADAGNARFYYQERITLKIIELLSKKILVTSDYVSRHYAPFIQDNRKLKEISQSVEIDKTCSLVRSNPVFTLALTGSFEVNKGQLEALSACRILKEKGVPFNIYLVGAKKNDYTEQVRKYVNENHLTTEVSIIEFTDRPVDYFKISDVALVCSQSEAFGRVTIEALKSGIPVIASNVGANPELITNGYNGFIYKKGDVQDLVEKILILLEPNQRDKFSFNASASVEGKYTRSQFAESLIQIMNNVNL